MFCGYDPAMSAGLLKFGEGITNSTLLKAAKAKNSIDDQIRLEMVQLEALVDELNLVETNSKDETYRIRIKAIKGLALVCLATFLSAKNISTEKEFRSHFSAQFAFYGDLVRALEDAFESYPPEMSLAEKTKLGVQGINNHQG